MKALGALRMEGLRFAYGDVPVIKGLDLTVEEGEMVGLAGANGAGKTTLLRLIGGALRPQSGNVSLGGTDLPALRPRDRARLVATVVQSPTAPLGFTALELVLMGRNPHLGLLQWEGPKDMDVCRKAMELTRTWDLACRSLSSLSGGEKQRVFIARALAQETTLLLLDEPTAHLDIGYQPVILDMIDDIRQEAGITVIAAMHDLTLAAQYCDRMALLHDGVVLALGKPSQVLRPETVTKAYGSAVYVGEHPLFSTPVVLPIGRGRKAI